MQAVGTIVGPVLGKNISLLCPPLTDNGTRLLCVFPKHRGLGELAQDRSMGIPRYRDIRILLGGGVLFLYYPGGHRFYLFLLPRYHVY